MICRTIDSDHAVGRRQELAERFGGNQTADAGAQDQCGAAHGI
jgi:hypothetical protein